MGQKKDVLRKHLSPKGIILFCVYTRNIILCPKYFFSIKYYVDINDYTNCHYNYPLSNFKYRFYYLQL